ncbi:hypothetical protein [Corallococcus exiguus]|uniref:Lipoprotein n=1 Tax=Corallococcus exiguus TaxID=83462 RepID=A0A7X4YDY3_9BACT|nr:hypothetical protein [Corallococcus exiguus]NBC43683.1 hypothetical protein [Corallococcus exiguus]TNV66369.1 hypothetical protein FH620_06725 [Corallococcus exiguus]
MRRIIAIAVIAFASTGCPSKLTRRHSRAISEGIPKDINRFSLSLFVLPVSQAEPTQKSFFDLDGRGQAAAIEVAGIEGKKERLDNVKTLVGMSVKSPVVQGVSRLDRPKARLVTNLIHRPFSSGNYDPADRIVWAEVRINLMTDAYSIIGYDKVDTGYETVDLGKLTRTANWSVAGTVGTTNEAAATVSPVEGASTSTKTTGGASVTAGAGETFGEEVALRRRYTSLAVSLAPNGRSIGILREGISGIDLTGSTTIDLQFRAAKSESTQVFAVEVPKKADERIGLASGKATYAPCNQFLLSGTATAVVRHVHSEDARTISEHDDWVAFEWHSAPAKGERAVYSFEMDPVVLYRIKTRANDYIKVREGGRAVDLVMTDEAEVFKMRTWLAAAFNQLSALQDPMRPFVDDSDSQLAFSTDPGFVVERWVMNEKRCPANASKAGSNSPPADKAAAD